MSNPSTFKQAMVDPIDDIVRQARQGSVSAIIQVLNEKLADAGVRTRAVFEQGILQLLCEAPKLEQLEQTVLVPQVRQILESLQPKRIRRVNINARIVREQQLLWLEEINRDPHNQLLWSEEIALKRPNPVQRFFQDVKQGKPLDPQAFLPKTSPRRLAREKRLFWRGLVGGASLSVFLVLVGWVFYSWLEENPLSLPQAEAPATQINGEEPPTTQAANPPDSGTTTEADPFVQAVNLAQSTVQQGQTATTSAEWLAIAARWQQASDLMRQIPPSDERYQTAQSRVELYRQNSEIALLKAEEVRQ